MFEVLKLFFKSGVYIPSHPNELLALLIIIGGALCFQNLFLIISAISIFVLTTFIQFHHRLYEWSGDYQWSPGNWVFIDGGQNTVYTNRQIPLGDILMWCKNYCRGAWVMRVDGLVIKFNRKSDEAMFRLFNSTLDQKHHPSEDMRGILIQ